MLEADTCQLEVTRDILSLIHACQFCHACMQSLCHCQVLPWHYKNGKFVVSIIWTTAVMHACIACTIHALTLLDDLDLGLVYFKFMSFTRNMRNAVCSIIVPCIDFYFLILSSYPGHSKKSIYSDLISTKGTHILRNEGFHASTLAGLAREIGSSWSQGQPNQNKIRNSTTRVFPLFTQISNCYERCIFKRVFAVASSL